VLLTFLKRLLMSNPDLLSVGDAAPDFECTSHTGDTIRLSDFRGQRLILWFFPKADTPG
jgi:peroxiredoxin Q/BCP